MPTPLTGGLTVAREPAATTRPATAGDGAVVAPGGGGPPGATARARERAGPRPPRHCQVSATPAQPKVEAVATQPVKQLTELAEPKQPSAGASVPAATSSSSMLN